MEKQTLDELLEESTLGQLKHLVGHPKSLYMCNVLVWLRTGRPDSKPRNDDPAPLIMQKVSMRVFTWGQVKLLRHSGSKNVAKKAMSVLKRKFGYLPPPGKKK